MIRSTSPRVSALAARIFNAIEPARIHWEVLHSTQKGARVVRAYDFHWKPFVEVEFWLEEFEEFAARDHVPFCGTLIGRLDGREFFAALASDFHSTGQGTVRAVFRAWHGDV